MTLERHLPTRAAPEMRPTTTHVPIQVEILPASMVPAGHRALRITTAYGFHVFPFTVENAQRLGQQLAAPGIVVPGR